LVEIARRCRTVLKSVLTQLWCNPESVSQRRFSLRRTCRHRALARTASEGTAHHTNDLRWIAWPVVRTVRTARAHRGRPTPGPRCSLIHHNALDRKALQKTPVLAMAPAQSATGPASAPNLRQNRISAANGHSLRFKCRATAATRGGVPLANSFLAA
jgi:hypothetical protein